MFPRDLGMGNIMDSVHVQVWRNWYIKMRAFRVRTSAFEETRVSATQVKISIIFLNTELSNILSTVCSLENTKVCITIKDRCD